MDQCRKCKNCNVDVSSDLSNCPLCGKYVLDDAKSEKVIQNKYSFTIYSLNEIYRAKWVSIIRVIFWLIGILSVVVNLIFKTSPYFFPYVVGALVMIMIVFISPFGKKQSYLKNITRSSIIISLFLIFIDAYDHLTMDTLFGWGLEYSAPLFLTATVLAASIMCLVNKRYEMDTMKHLLVIMIYAIIYFLVVLFAFPNLKIWPSLVFMCVSVGFFIIIQTIKRNLLWKELQKSFHI